jgi:hypothetical protein
VRRWLAQRAVKLGFELSPDRYLAFDRQAVEMVLAREAVGRMQAAE